MYTLLKYLKNYKIECFLAPFFKMIEAIFELLVPLVIADIIDNGIPSKDSIYIVQRIAILITFAVIGITCAIIAQFFSAKVATAVSRDVRKDLYNHIQSLSFQEIDQIGTSSFITRMSSDINQVQTGINMFLRLFLRSPFVVFGALVMAFIVNVKTALIFTIIIPLLFIVVFAIIIITIPLFKKVQTRLDILLNKSRENIKGIKVIRAFNQEQNQINTFKKQNDSYVKMQIFASKISALMNPITYLLINIAIIIILFIGSKEISTNKMAQGELVAQYNYMGQILIELIKLANLVITLTKAMSCWKRVYQLFSYKNSQVFVDESNLSNTNSAYSIVFDNVCMRYFGNKENSIENISFKIKKGESFGIIGGTGAGKTTIANLLPRYYDNTSGTIYINGNNINNYSKKDLRKIIGTVRQKSVMFNGTIKENLLVTRTDDVDDEEINNAIAISQADSIINKKKFGFDTIITQGGKNLSGGEKQRLNIARTILQRPEILILDDSSSALDYLTDYKLRSSLKQLKPSPTIIIISQRASSVMDCDKIIVLDEGKVVNIGNHQTLLKESSIYKEIYYTQFPMEDNI